MRDRTSTESEIRSQFVEDHRPWGRFKQYVGNAQCTVKIITVEPNQTLSLQSHAHRDELWIILDKGLRVQLNDDIIDPEPDEEIVILRGTRHRLSSRGKQGRVLEVSFGTFDENDIQRFEDVYGRT